jgi:hypothetical protein
MTLALNTTAEDVEAIVGYLKTKATGATRDDAKAALGSAPVDPRKVNALITWGLVAKDGNKLKLTSLGWELSRASEQKKPELYSRILRALPPYVSAIDWMFHQGFDQVANVALAAHWHEHHPADLGTESEETMKMMAVCFFRLCQAAGIGTLRIGRRGQPTRLEINRENLSQFIAESGFETRPIREITEEPLEPEAPPVPGEEGVQEEVPTPTPTPAVEVTKPRVFISHSKNMEIVEQIKTMLELADLEYEVAEEEETTAIPVPDKVLTAMRRCNAAVICVTADEQEKDEDSQQSINENVLIEIGAAFVLYDKKVVLVWDKRLKIPSNLQGLYRCEFEGNELSWATGMKLMKAVSKFKAGA